MQIGRLGTAIVLDPQRRQIYDWMFNREAKTTFRIPLPHMRLSRKQNKQLRSTRMHTAPPPRCSESRACYTLLTPGNMSYIIQIRGTLSALNDRNNASSTRPSVRGVNIYKGYNSTENTNKKYAWIIAWVDIFFRNYIRSTIFCRICFPDNQR